MCLGLSGCIDVTHNDVIDEATSRALIAPPGTHADVAIVLGCPAEEETGKLSLCERCRVKTAVRAWKAGEVTAVLFSGGAAHNQFVEADVMADAAIRRGLPPDAALREGRALTTWMNLRYADRLMHERGLETALVISTAAHLPRARRFIEWYGIRAVGYRACDWEAPESPSSSFE